MSSAISTVVILAAGLGTRMKSATPKVLHQVCGAPLLSYVLAAAAQLRPERTVVVLGHGSELVEPLLPEGCRVAIQEQQLGTGHAFLSAAADVAAGEVMVLSGDTPLITGEVLARMAEVHGASGCQATIMTMALPDPTGYGRVVRGGGGGVTRIVEHRDASADELALTEVNAGMYILPARESIEILKTGGTDNDQGEVYLTDVIAGLWEAGARIGAFTLDDPRLALGVNSRLELAEAQAIMRERILRHWMLAGVTVEDPASVHIDSTVRLAEDVRILPFTCLRGETEVGRDSEIGPGTTLIDARVGAACRIRHSFVDQAVLEAGAQVGPFSYLRPEAHLLEGSKAGAFVEIKKSIVGRGSKVPHLSYIGDTIIGAGTNIGAGNITANYDGRRKHRTTIGDNVKTGSDSVFVAPVEVGDNATIGAGSIITKDVPPGALGIARQRQKNIPDYVNRDQVAGETEEHGREG